MHTNNQSMKCVDSRALVHLLFFFELVWSEFNIWVQHEYGCDYIYFMNISARYTVNAKYKRLSVKYANEA